LEPEAQIEKRTRDVMKIRREESKESQSLKLGIVRLGRAAGKVITGHSHTL
jgi:hypothetical protein